MGALPIVSESLPSVSRPPSIVSGLLPSVSGPLRIVSGPLPIVRDPLSMCQLVLVEFASRMTFRSLGRVGFLLGKIKQ